MPIDSSPSSSSASTSSSSGGNESGEKKNDDGDFTFVFIVWFSFLPAVLAPHVLSRWILVHKRHKTIDSPSRNRKAELAELGKVPAPLRCLLQVKEKSFLKSKKRKCNFCAQISTPDDDDEDGGGKGAVGRFHNNNGNLRRLSTTSSMFKELPLTSLHNSYPSNGDIWTKPAKVIQLITFIERAIK